MPKAAKKEEPMPQMPQVPEADALRNARMGFRHVWDVAQEYEVNKDDRILREVQGSGFRRVYAPAVEPGLVEAFAAVRDDTMLKEFAKRFGLLGYAHTMTPDKRVGGDPVDWALARARDVRVALEMQSLLEEVQATGREEKLRRQLPKLLREAGLRLGGRDEAEDPDKSFEHMGRTERWRLTEAWPNDPARAAWECLGDIINPLLRRIRFEVRPGDEVDVPNVVLRFDALIDVIGWRLATQLRRLKPYVCKECGRLKFATRSTRETCSFECRKKWWKKHGKKRARRRSKR